MEELEKEKCFACDSVLEFYEEEICTECKLNKGLEHKKQIPVFEINDNDETW